MLTRVTIGIQARSTSRRFPEKVFQTLGGRTVLRHVIDSCSKAMLYLNNWGTKKILVDLALCIPEGDPIKTRIQDSILMIEGPEQDVLARYLILSEKSQSDYIVRITADCPLIPPFVISKCITTAVMNRYDYLSNVDERCRTTPDGWDTEVISRRLLSYVGENAQDPKDREHVTTFIRSHPPAWISQGMIINFLDLSHLKLSLDTPEDLDVIRQAYDQIEKKLVLAKEIFGRKHAHRF